MRASSGRPGLLPNAERRATPKDVVRPCDHSLPLRATVMLSMQPTLGQEGDRPPVAWQRWRQRPRAEGNPSLPRESCGWALLDFGERSSPSVASEARPRPVARALAGIIASYLRPPHFPSKGAVSTQWPCTKQRLQRPRAIPTI